MLCLGCVHVFVCVCVSVFVLMYVCESMYESLCVCACACIVRICVLVCLTIGVCVHLYWCHKSSCLGSWFIILLFSWNFWRKVLLVYTYGKEYNEILKLPGLNVEQYGHASPSQGVAEMTLVPGVLLCLGHMTSASQCLSKATDRLECAYR
jgi:hypothetical protein